MKEVVTKKIGYDTDTDIRGALDRGNHRGVNNGTSSADEISSKNFDAFLRRYVKTRRSVVSKKRRRQRARRRRRQRQDKRGSTLQIGGEIIGKGHDNNIVYTMDELVVMYPQMRKVSFESEFDVEVVQHYSVEDVMTTYQGALLQQSVALKHVSDPFESVYEINVNGLIRSIFTHVDLLHITVLHPLYDTIKVDTGKATPSTMSNSRVNKINRDVVQNTSPVGIYPVKELVYKRMMGSIDRLGMTDEKVMIEAARSVLIFLCVIHKNGYIHMDIKPENILYDFNRKDISSVLADYGLMMRSDEVFDKVKKTGSYFQGTIGFMSPILTSDDHENRVYVKLNAVLHCCKHKTVPMMWHSDPSNAPADAKDDPETTEFWDTFFEAQKAKMSSASDLAKIDLQSLAFTLLDMLARIKRHQVTAAATAEIDTGVSAVRKVVSVRDATRYPVIEAFIPILLLYGPSSVHRAPDALRALYRLMNKNISNDREAIAAIRAEPLPSTLL
jgi:serine/threonine protein kinase